MPITVALAGDAMFGRGVAAAARRGRPALARAQEVRDVAGPKCPA